MSCNHPSIGITKHIVVVNIVIGLPGIEIPAWADGCSKSKSAHRRTGENAIGRTLIVPFSILANVLGVKMSNFRYKRFAL
jgi:hypothetical protein